MCWRVRVVLLVVLLWGGWGCLAALAGGRGGQGWQVVVNDRQAAGSKTVPARWVSVWADGKTSSRNQGLVVSMDGHLWTLDVSTQSDKGSCAEGKFPFSYSVDELIASPLGAGQGRRVLMGQGALGSAKDVMRDHLANCDGIKALPSQPETTESYERSKIRLLSNYNGKIGLELVSESLAYGRPEAMVSNDWGAYGIDKGFSGKEGRKLLPSGTAGEASARFLKLPKSERDPFSPGDFSHFILVPAGGGVAVEFGVPGTAASARGEAQVVRVERPGGLGDAYDKARLAFVSKHRGLIPWDKVSFYTIAPDGSAVVYAQNGGLYWQGLTGKARPIGHVQEVRGWQWHRGPW